MAKKKQQSKANGHIKQSKKTKTSPRNRKQTARRSATDTGSSAGGQIAGDGDISRSHVTDSDSDGFEEVATGSMGSSHKENIGGFPGIEEEEEDSENELQDTRTMVMQQNRKKKKSGGFQSMGLSHSIFKGIIRKGYKMPTPIQRKTIPLIMDGKDVVAMARTGSGKTAAFLIPLFEKLKTHLSTGARGLILTPTRELALQTLKFTKELGRFTGLKSAVILGGDKIEDQFAALHENPDIIIATPGRFMHVLVEMDLKLSSVEYVVFDEADRLFEMGFQEQLHEILGRLRESRQTLLFSATLPKLLVEFAKAGLHDPTLLRLDVDTKLSEQLKLAFFQCRSEDKLAILLHLLRNVVKPAEQTVVFAATKHHVEYLNMILQEAGISCSYTYSSLDQTARKINVGKFRNKKTMVLVVTDLAARGIDIPMLDNVINFNFPAKPKLFVHRVGRVARAGRSGIAYSLIGPDELPFAMDLHLFLGRPMKYMVPGKTKKDEDGLFGMVPQTVIDDEEANLRLWKEKTEVAGMQKVISNAYMQYSRSRPSPSSESIKRVKQMSDVHIGYHPLFGTEDQTEEERAKLLDSMKSYRPHSTIFEVNATKKTQAFDVMKKKRDWHRGVIEISTKKKGEKLAKFLEGDEDERGGSGVQEMSTETELQEAFATVVAPKRRAGDHAYEPKNKKKKTAAPVRDEENYVSYRPKDYQSEKGLSLGTSFETEAASATMDIAGDEEQNAKKMKNQLKWDRKKKKFVREMGSEGNNKNKKIRTESGALISATYKANLYKDWLEKTKAEKREDDDEDSDGDRHQRHSPGGRRGGRHGRRGGHVMGSFQKPGKVGRFSGHGGRGGETRGRRGQFGEGGRGGGSRGGASRGGGSRGGASRGGGSRGGASRGGGGRGGSRGGSSHKGRGASSGFKFGGHTELKRTEQILKKRQIVAKKQAFQKQREKKHGQKQKGRKR